MPRLLLLRRRRMAVERRDASRFRAWLGAARRAHLLSGAQAACAQRACSSSTSCSTRSYSALKGRSSRDARACRSAGGKSLMCGSTRARPCHRA